MRGVPAAFAVRLPRTVEPVVLPTPHGFSYGKLWQPCDIDQDLPTNKLLLHVEGRRLRCHVYP